MKTKFASLLLVLITTGCATQAELDARSIEDIDISGKDGACVRQSLASYSSCAGNATGTGISSGAVISGLAACKSAYKVAISTCPAE